MNKLILDNIIKPVITKKSNENEKLYKFTFIVKKKVNKKILKKKIEEISKIKVKKINIINYKSIKKIIKNIKGKTKSYKKAIISTKNKIKLNIL